MLIMIFFKQQYPPKIYFCNIIKSNLASIFFKDLAQGVVWCYVMSVVFSIGGGGKPLQKQKAK